MDEVSFGPQRESRLPSGRWRALIAGAVTAIAAGVAVTVILTGHQRGSDPPQSAGQPTGQPAALPAASADWLPVTCTAVRAPSLAGMPAGMRPGAQRVIIDAMPAGHCEVLPTVTPAG
jgi:hypothetical protein